MRITNWLRGLRGLIVGQKAKGAIRKSHQHSATQQNRSFVEELELRTLLTLSPGTDGPAPFDVIQGPTPVQAVEFNYLPMSTQILPVSGLLTGPQSGDPFTIAMNYLTSNAAALGLTANDVINSQVTSAFQDQDSGTTYIYLKQQFNGLEVENATLNVAVTSAGEVITVGSRFVTGLPALEGQSEYDITPRLMPVEALLAIADELKLPTGVVTELGGSGGLSQDQNIENSSWSLDPIPAHLEYVATDIGPRLSWSTVIRTLDGEHWYNAFVDAQSGQLLWLSDWIDDLATYNVVAAPAEHPDDGGRKVLVNPANPTYSPFGWHDINGAAGAEFTDTRGNNVFAQEDLDDNDTGGTRPDGGADLQFDFPFDLTQEPSSYLSTAITNLFYTNNYLHDVHAAYGFTEAAGNFQFLNYSGQGLGGDAVQADAQDGSGTNNANFGTPPDGAAPRMQQYIFVDTTPYRDSDVDNGIIIHEYGHGVSNRLTGGAADVNALDALQSGGMGEGWSDFWTLMFTQRITDSKLDSFPLGIYVYGEPPDSNGIRTYPYSFNMGVNPHTWDDYNTESQEVHYSGEIWASALWDLNWLLIDKYGFDPDLNTGYFPGGGPAGAGNKLALRLVMDGLKLQPANPSFVQARDAVLAADQALTGGQNQRAIWTAFARRGLGFGASTDDSDATDVTTSFAMPPAFANPSVIDVNPAGASSTALASLDFVFSEGMDQASFAIANDVSSFTGPGGTDLLGTITGFSWTSSTTLQVTFTALPAEGQFSLVLGPNILSSDNGSAMDQDGDGSTGESVQDRFTAYFAYDSTPLVVTSTSPPADTIAYLPVNSITVNFNEAFDAGSLQASDLQVSQGTVTGVSVVDADTATFTISGLVDGTLFLNLKYGAVTDLAGFPSEFHSSAVTLLYSTEFGDAPDSYGTLDASNGAKHSIGGPYLGILADTEIDGQPNATATGDGSDEDGIVLYQSLVAGSTTQILVTTGGAGAKLLDFFFDFDHSGAFGDHPNEIFSATLAGGTELISFAIPAGASGDTYARFRLSTAGGLGPKGSAPDGEVEDYLFPILTTDPGVDYGDAPQPGFPTSLANNGARHAAIGPQLGETRDIEGNGQPNATATGDGLDEDGVIFPDIFRPGVNIPVTITSSPGGGELNAFFDWNRNGVWGDVSDEIVSASLTSGTQTIFVAVPATVDPGVTYARFRISTVGGLSPREFAPDGEVEDYQLLVIDPFTPADVENFDGVTAPSLPAGWIIGASGVTPQFWNNVAGAGSDTAPNHAFVANPGDTTDSLLTSPTVVPTLPRLKFRNNYNTEFTYDGGVLELSINGGSFVDILAAGGSFVTGGYVTTISLDYESALAGRPAWTGNSGGYLDTIVNLPVTTMNQNVRFRWRFASDNLVPSTGWRIDSIQFTSNGTVAFDYGDAPDSTFPTLIASGGASHAQGFSAVFLGNSVDVESNGQPNSNATGDDLAGDDEDGVTLPSNIAQGRTVDFIVNAAAPGLLSAWIDYNDNGGWNDPGEQIARDLVLAAGDNTVTVTIPLTATVTAETFARFRLTTNSGQGPGGRAPDGEVEDYALVINPAPPPVDLSVSAEMGTEAAMTVITVTATIPTAIVGDQTVVLGVSGINITAGDYSLSTTIITIPSGMTSGSVTFTIQDDAAIEDVETAVLTISNLSDGLRLGTVVTQDVVIIDNDTYVSIVNSNNGTEGITPTDGKFQVTQSVPKLVDTVVTYTVTGSATAGIDYTALSGTVTILAGQLSADIDVSILNNAIVEGTESVVVTLGLIVSSDDGVALNPNPASLTATVDIVDDDIAAFTVGDVTVDEAAGTMAFTLSTSSTLDIDITIDIAFGEGTATGGGIDYTSTTQSFTFLAGEFSKNFSVSISEDNIVEVTETFNSILSTLTAYGTHNVDLSQQGTGSITDNDAATVSIVKIQDGIEAPVPTNGRFQIVQTVPSSGDTIVSYSISGTATNGADYTTLTGNFTIPAGQTVVDLDIAAFDDAVVEDFETVILTLTGFVTHDADVTLDPNPVNTTANLTITDNDAATVSIAQVLDGMDQVTPVNGKFRVTQTAESSTDTVVQYSVAGNATPGAGNDYVTLSGTVTILAGETTADIDVNVLYDFLIEGNETVTITLTGFLAHDPQVTLDANSANLTATANILEADTNTLLISSPTVTEGNSGIATMTFTVTSPTAVLGGFTVAFGVTEVSVDGSDYTLVTNSPLTFTGTANETHTIMVNVIGDLFVEANEVLTVTLGTITPVAPVNAANFGTGAIGTGTILNDDTSLLAINSPTITEGDSGISVMTFAVTSPTAVQGGFTVDFSVANLTTNGSDFTVLTSSPLIFAGTAGESQTITVNMIGDLLVEGDETFSITLGTVTPVSPGAEIGILTGAIGTGQITDDDLAIFTINDVSVSEGSGTLTFTLGTVKPLDIDMTIDVTFGGGTATGGDVDYAGTTQQITFLAGQTSQLVNVIIADNSIVEATETFNATLSTSTVLGSHRIDLSDIGTGTILDDDNARFAINNVSVDESIGTLVFDLTISNPLDIDATINVAFSDQTAVNGADYTGTTQSITFLAGQTSKQVSVTINNDGINEVTENFVATLATSTPLGDRTVDLTATGIGTIVDEDAATFVTNNVNGSENGLALVFDLATDVPFDIDVTLNVTFTDVSAMGNGTDYSSLTQQITFLAGQLSQTVTVPIVNDGLVEAAESFSVALSANTSLNGRTVDLTDTGVGTIDDDDTATIAIAKILDGAEGISPTNGQFRVTQTAPSSTDTVITYAITGLATPGSGQDYATLTGTVTILAGQTTADIDVTVLDDAIVEGTETVIVTLTGFVSHDPEVTLDPSAAQRTATVEIADNDTTLLSITNVTVTEGNSGFQTVTYTVTSPNAVQGGYTVAFNVADITTNNNDYVVITNSPLTFVGTANETQTISIQILGDTVVEGNEQFTVNLGAVSPQTPVPAASIISGAIGSGTISNDDSTILTISSPTVVEGDSGTTLMTFNVSSSLAVEGGFTVAFNTANFTADSGDYLVLTASPLIFVGAANEVQTITVSVFGDTIVERDEQLRITLGTVTPVAPVFASNITSGAVGTGTITDDDTATFTINNVTVGESAGTFVFDLVTTKPLDIDVTLTVTFSDLTATGGSIDYGSQSQQITFLAGETSKTVSVSILEDNFVEATETFGVSLSTSTALLGRSVDLSDTGTGSITDNDTATFTINDVVVAEDATTVTFDLRTDKAVDTDLIVAVTINGVTAMGGGVDFTGTTLFISFPAGLLSRPVTLLISEDQIVEADETFTASLSTGTSLGDRSVILDDTGTATILDNDSASVSIIKLSDSNEAQAPSTGKFRVTQTAVSSTDTVVTYSISGTATPGTGNDYSTLSGMVTIPAGQTSVDINVFVLADLLVESNETVVLTLTGFSSRDPQISLDPSSSRLFDTLFILDDDVLVLTNVNSPFVAENTPISTVIVDANSDPAATPGHTLTYSLSGPDAARFNINSVTGELTFQSIPDFDLPVDQGADNVYHVTVTVTSDVTPVRSTSQDIVITVTGVNDNTPVFIDASPVFSIPENSDVDSNVGSVIAIDADRPQQNITYSIVSGNAAGAFRIDPTTGRITVADSAPLNFEATTVFTLTIRATDNGVPSNTSDAVVVIQVTNVFEGPTITIPEDAGTFVPGRTRVPVTTESAFTYGDVANPSFHGAVLAVSISSGRMNRDTLGIFKGDDPAGLITTKRRGVYANGALIGTFSGGRGRHPNLFVKLNERATSSSVEALMNRISFGGTSTILTTRVLQLQLIGVEGFNSNLATREISVE